MWTVLYRSSSEFTISLSFFVLFSLSIYLSIYFQFFLAITFDLFIRYFNFKVGHHFVLFISAIVGSFFGISRFHLNILLFCDDFRINRRAVVRQTHPQMYNISLDISALVWIRSSGINILTYNVLGFGLFILFFKINCVHWTSFAHT